MAWSQIATATAELRQARDTISTNCRELTKIAQLKIFIISLEESVASMNPVRRVLKSELAAATTESTRLVQLFDSIRAEVATYKSVWVRGMPLFDPTLKISVHCLGHPSRAWLKLSMRALVSR